MERPGKAGLFLLFLTVPLCGCTAFLEKADFLDVIAIEARDKPVPLPVSPKKTAVKEVGVPAETPSGGYKQVEAVVRRRNGSAGTANGLESAKAPPPPPAQAPLESKTAEEELSVAEVIKSGLKTGMHLFNWIGPSGP